MALRDLRDLLPKFEARDAADRESYPAESVKDLHAAGALLAPFPVELGGEGTPLTEAAEAILAIATASPSLALIASMPLGLAGVYASGSDIAPDAHRAGWNAQVERAAADYLAGELYAACNSEKGAGGSLAATKTVAALDSGTWLISGEKILASSGRFADHFFSTAKVTQEDLPGAGVVEFFLMPTSGEGVEVLQDWDGFGMRCTESQTVRYDSAAAEGLFGFPNFIETVRPLQYFFCLFSAIPLGCAKAMLRQLGEPAPTSPALRLRLAEATMRYEAMHAYLLQTAGQWRPCADNAYGQLVLRMKTYVTEESVKLCAELLALGGGRNYRRTGRAANLLADAFAGTALRPPLTLALETLSETFTLPES
jgi:alkylation response protein AidB-like acyl-CoA dehydrogenase